MIECIIRGELGRKNDTTLRRVGAQGGAQTKLIRCMSYLRVLTTLFSRFMYGWNFPLRTFLVSPPACFNAVTIVELLVFRFLRCASCALL